jgi:DNA adenine methylase
MQGNHKSVINISCVPKPSPFRYPGGKSWLIPHVRQWLLHLTTPVHFAEPFAGGANVGLTVAIENLADSVTLVELDRDVASVWQTVLNGHSAELSERITEFQMSKKAAKAVLSRRCNSLLSRAFATIVKNRVRRAGIMAESASLLKHGENGRGVKSRWYPETLKRRIEKIAEHRNKITFLQQDGLELIRQRSADGTVAFFVDPPYTVAGQRLYTHSDIDHRKLFELVAAVQGNVLMTYDNTAEVRALAREFGLKIRRVHMRTSHHSQKVELLISRDFSWFNPRALRPKQRLAGKAVRKVTKR